MTGHAPLDPPPDTAPTHDQPAGRDRGHAGHGGHGWLAMLACCVPMVLIVLLLVLR